MIAIYPVVMVVVEYIYGISFGGNGVAKVCE